jgi:anti-anti-sigma factor
MFYVQEENKHATVISVDKDIDIGSSPALEATIELAFSHSDRAVIVDLTPCRYCDSTGLSVFIRAKRRWQSRCLIVLPTESPIRRVFAITKLEQALEICESLEDALATLDPDNAA